MNKRIKYNVSECIRRFENSTNQDVRNFNRLFPLTKLKGFKYNDHVTILELEIGGIRKIKVGDQIIRHQLY